MQKLPIIKNKSLRLRAFTHRSYVNEHPDAGEHNERLEFLGDAVLGFLVGEFLYNRYPQMNEAQLTRLRSNLVDEKQLARFAIQLGIGEMMRLGKGAVKEGGRQNPSLLSDTFEAIVGAYFLEAGSESVRQYIQSLFAAEADNLASPESDVAPQHLIDSKGQFQQWALAKFVQNPEYSIVDETGPDHAKEFVAQVQVKGKVYGIGKGRNKKEAEKRAAEAALKAVGVV
jgi:ribonuclease-3